MQRLCPFKTHRNWNRTDSAWVACSIGKLFKSLGHDVLPEDKTLEDYKTELEGKSPLVVAAMDEPEGDSMESIDFLIPVFLSVPRAQEEEGIRQVKVLALLDTGALADRDLVGAHIWDRHRASFTAVSHTCSAKFCSPLMGSKCSSCVAEAVLTVTLPTYATKGSDIVVSLPVYVVEMRYDLIIGMKSILQHDLLPTLREFFCNEYPLTDASLGLSSSSLLTSDVRTSLVSSLDLDATQDRQKSTLQGYDRRYIPRNISSESVSGIMMVRRS